MGIEKCLHADEGSCAIRESLERPAKITRNMEVVVGLEPTKTGLAVPRPLRRSIHRVSRSLPRLDSAFQHLDVCKALRLVFRCLTDSARFAWSRSIEDDLLGL
jgi:hypothetical protein